MILRRALCLAFAFLLASIFHENIMASRNCAPLYTTAMEHVREYVQQCETTGESYGDCKQEPVAVELAQQGAEDFLECNQTPGSGAANQMAALPGSVVEMRCYYDDGGGGYGVYCIIEDVLVKSDVPSLGLPSKEPQFRRPLECSAFEPKRSQQLFRS